MSIEQSPTSAAQSLPSLLNTEGAGTAAPPIPIRSSILAGITDSAGFSLVAPQLKAALDRMAEPQSNILETLADNISRLQDGFVDALYALFKDDDAVLSHKITLTLSREHRLCVAGDHPHKETIEALLVQAPELSAAFFELASQSIALRHLSSLRTVVHATIRPEDALFPDKADEAVYLISLKGDMNHFYFRPATYGL